MNANELADELETYANPKINQAAAFIRKQQEKLTKYELRHQAQRDRIAILEAQLKKASDK